MSLVTRQAGEEGDSGVGVGRDGAATVGDAAGKVNLAGRRFGAGSDWRGENKQNEDICKVSI